ncbi:MAG: YafY family transcriptional regulator [Actinomycetota bacterium]|nr:YafY family transcriptional regulator [Actinomycetota bacterium]
MAETTERVLRLLGMLQTSATWTGPELARRLDVTTRTVRRDVERLRKLGYPVNAVQGATGGYRLGAGRALPPLLLDDEEAVAMAVSLRLAAGGTVAGASEAALRALTKLDQVLPARLRSEVAAIQASTDTLGGPSAQVDGEALLVLARACRDRARARFGYVAHDGGETERRVEPVRLVATGRRWYLMAFDLDREDWRTFRLDRMHQVAATTWRFPPREHPDPVEFVGRSVTSPYPVMARVRVLAPYDVARGQVAPTVGHLTRLDDDSCLLEAGAGGLHVLAFHLCVMGFDIEVLDPPELRELLAALGPRMTRAGTGRGIAGTQ